LLSASRWLCKSCLLSLCKRTYGNLVAFTVSETLVFCGLVQKVKFLEAYVCFSGSQLWTEPLVKNEFAVSERQKDISTKYKSTPNTFSHKEAIRRLRTDFRGRIARWTQILLPVPDLLILLHAETAELLMNGYGMKEIQTAWLLSTDREDLKLLGRSVFRLCKKEGRKRKAVEDGAASLHQFLDASTCSLLSKKLSIGVKRHVGSPVSTSPSQAAMGKGGFGKGWNNGWGQPSHAPAWNGGDGWSSGWHQNPNKGGSGWGKSKGPYQAGYGAASPLDDLANGVESMLNQARSLNTMAQLGQVLNTAPGQG
jgi:hypothetical protein